MKLPKAEAARIADAKIVNYLLSPTHRSGRSKAAFFTRFGFQSSRWRELANALLMHAAASQVILVEQTVFGTRYVVDGSLTSPDGADLNVRAVWFIDKGGSEPRFITAHPLKRKKT